MLLSKSSKGPKFDDSEVLTLNKGFKAKTLMTDLRPERPKPSVHETVQQGNREIQVFRIGMMKFNIIKQMKAHGMNGNSIGHKDLQGKVEPQIRGFPFTQQMFRKAVEECVTEEYMERSQADRTKFSYLA